MVRGSFFLTSYASQSTKSMGFARPKEVGHFSIDEKQAFTPDDHQKKYLHLPDTVPRRCLRVDLNKGFNAAAEHNVQDGPTSLECMLRWILLNRSQLKERAYRPDEGGSFVFNRSLLSWIASLSHRRSAGKIYATRFRGVIYLRSTCSAREREQTETLESYRRHRFRHLLTSTEKSGRTPASEVDYKEPFFVVLRSRLNEHNLLYYASIGAEDPKVSARSTSRFVHFASYELRGPRWTLKNVRHLYLMMLWCHSYFAGISKVICGLNDGDGKLHEIVECPTSELPAVARNFWVPGEVVNFCDEFLTFVNDVVEKDDPRVVYCFSREFGSDTIQCIEMTHRNDDEVLLPKWFVSELDR